MQEAIDSDPKMEKDENMSSKHSSTAEEKAEIPPRKKLQTNLVMAAILMNAFLAALDMLIVTVAQQQAPYGERRATFSAESPFC